MALTNEQARALRVRAAREKLSGNALALEVGLKPRTVQHLLVGYTFPHAGGPIRERHYCERKLKAHDARRIRRQRGKFTSPELARDYNCSASLIRHIWTWRCWGKA